MKTTDVYQYVSMLRLVILILFVMSNDIVANTVHVEPKTQRLCPLTMGGWSKPCKDGCSTDNDCENNMKCCRLSTCATYCAVPIIVDENGIVSQTDIGIKPSIETTSVKEEIITSSTTPSTTIPSIISPVDHSTTPVARSDGTETRDSKLIDVVRLALDSAVKKALQANEIHIGGNINQENPIFRNAIETIEQERPVSTSAIFTTGSRIDGNINQEGPVSRSAIQTIRGRLGENINQESPVSKSAIQTIERHIGNIYNAESTISSNCQDECKRHLECGTEHVCVKIGCRHVCRAISSNGYMMHAESYVQLRQRSQMQNDHMHRNNQLNPSQYDRCVHQCTTNSDCKYRACVNINCNIVCKRHLSSSYN